MDISKLYTLRKNYTIIAITGRTCSGCTEVTNLLLKGFYENNIDIYPKPDDENFLIDNNHNSYRKYRIVYNYALQNFKSHKVIYYKDVLLAYIMSYGVKEFAEFLNSEGLKNQFKTSGLQVSTDFSDEISQIVKWESYFETVRSQATRLICNVENRNKKDCLNLYNFFENKEFKSLAANISDILKSNSLVKRNKVLQIIASNIRMSGNPFSSDVKPNINYSFTIAELINDIIKGIKESHDASSNIEVVIDSLRNPFEIMFFKQRFSAFYVIAVNRDDEDRKAEITSRFKEDDAEDIKKLLEEEHSGVDAKDFFKQNVSMCLQQADIHITNRDKKLAKRMNDERYLKKESTSPYFSVGMQIIKYVSLIDHPGLITPSPEERCMQLAYTAKYNSGCISRQVGAAITDENYSIKAIGWNNTPEGQVPCNLRNVNDLLEDKNVSGYSPYEQSAEFKNFLKPHFTEQIITHANNLHGRNVCFCFKSIYNSKFEGKNQVHTRSLHAEESAFLQITKYGGTGIKGGKLFTTASPCELCSKKAYQLGIKVIYYIDPYPGIAKQQILEGGSINPELRAFSGAIGNAYHWLYEPFMPYKDELGLILEHHIPDLTKRLKTENIQLTAQNEKLLAEIMDLKRITTK